MGIFDQMTAAAASAAGIATPATPEHPTDPRDFSSLPPPAPCPACQSPIFYLSTISLSLPGSIPGFPSPPSPKPICLNCYPPPSRSMVARRLTIISDPLFDRWADLDEIQDCKLEVVGPDGSSGAVGAVGAVASTESPFPQAMPSPASNAALGGTGGRGGESVGDSLDPGRPWSPASQDEPPPGTPAALVAAWEQRMAEHTETVAAVIREAKAAKAAREGRSGPGGQELNKMPQPTDGKLVVYLVRTSSDESKEKGKSAGKSSKNEKLEQISIWPVSQGKGRGRQRARAATSKKKAAAVEVKGGGVVEVPAGAVRVTWEGAGRWWKLNPVLQEPEKTEAAG